jgi:hypothetical protein
MISVRTVGPGIVSVRMTRRGGRGAETPRPGPAQGVKVCGGPAQIFLFLVPSPNVPPHVRSAHSLPKPRQRPLICSATYPFAPAS